MATVGETAVRVSGPAQTRRVRDVRLEVLKGLAILLVVLGHSLQADAGQGGFDANPAFRVIYAFHMPFFMFLAGAVGSYSSDVTSLGSLARKARTLLVPFVFWYLVQYLVQLAKGDAPPLWHHLLLGIQYVDNGLWFLPALFLNFVVLAVTLRARRYLWWTVYPLALLLIDRLPTPEYGLGFLRVHFMYFLAGFLLRRRNARLPALVGVAALVAYPFAALTWYRTQAPTFGPQLHDFVVSVHHVGAEARLLRIYDIALAFLGIAAAHALARLICQAGSRVSWAFAALGGYTLDIYATHTYFLWAPGHGGAWALFRAAVGLSLALAVSLLVLRRIRLVDRLALGGRGAKTRRPGSRMALPS